MRRKQRRLLTIYQTEQSREQTKYLREQKLRSSALSGEKAEIILDFADKTFEDAENYVLTKMLDPTSDLAQLQADYRAAYAFYQKVKNTVVEGRLAQKSLREMQDNE